MTQYPTDPGGESTVTDQVREQVTQTAEVAQEKARGAAQQARGRFRDQVDQRSTQAGDTVGDTASRVSQATPGGVQVERQARRAAGLAQENPLGLAIGAAAIGFLAGLAMNARW